MSITSYLSVNQNGTSQWEVLLNKYDSANSSDSLERFSLGKYGKKKEALAKVNELCKGGKHRYIKEGGVITIRTSLKEHEVVELSTGGQVYSMSEAYRASNGASQKATMLKCIEVAKALSEVRELPFVLPSKIKPPSPKEKEPTCVESLKSTLLSQIERLVEQFIEGDGKKGGLRGEEVASAMVDQLDGMWDHFLGAAGINLEGALPQEVAGFAKGALRQALGAVGLKGGGRGASSSSLQAHQNKIEGLLEVFLEEERSKLKDMIRKMIKNRNKREKDLAKTQMELALTRFSKRGEFNLTPQEQKEMMTLGKRAIHSSLEDLTGLISEMF